MPPTKLQLQLMDPQSEPESLFLGWCVLFLTPTQASLAKTNHKTSPKQRCLQNALFLAKKKCGKKLGWLPKTNRVLEQSRSFSLAICEAKKKTPPKNMFWLFQEGVFFAWLAFGCWACWVLLGLLGFASPVGTFSHKFVWDEWFL